MKAIVQDRYGSPDLLQLQDIDDPVPASDELLVRVHAAALNALDWHIMRGDPYMARFMDRKVFGRHGPKGSIRGRDFAGVVEAVGSGVTGFRPGDEVYGDTDATFAEYVRIPADLAEPKPANLSFAQAAAMPVAGGTALMGLCDVGQVQPGQRVLLNGASGGVGTFAVQIAKSLGAEVTAVCSTRNVDLVRSIGADEVIDYTRADFARTDRRYDVVFDLVGNRSLTDCRRVLTPTGTLVLSGGGSSDGGSLVGPLGLMIRAMVLSPLVRQRIRILMAKPSRQNLATLRKLAESGKLTPVIDRTYPLADVPDAIRYLEKEHARAKVVITI